LNIHITSQRYSEGALTTERTHFFGELLERWKLSPQNDLENPGFGVWTL
jgi:hypothetical protein